MTDPDRCPTCGGPAVARCRCPLGDMHCDQHHSWFHCPSCGVTVPGKSDHGKDADYHLCPACRANPKE